MTLRHEIIGSDGIEIYNSDSVTTISISEDYYKIHGLVIARDEVSKLPKEVDLHKIQQMLNSSDREMFNLGIKTLQEYTIYAGRIYQAIRDNYSLKYIVDDYVRNNKFNLGKLI